MTELVNQAEESHFNHELVASDQRDCSFGKQIVAVMVPFKSEILARTSTSGINGLLKPMLSIGNDQFSDQVNNAIEPSTINIDNGSGVATTKRLAETARDYPGWRRARETDRHDLFSDHSPELMPGLTTQAGACWAAGGWPVIIRDPVAAQRNAAVDYIKDNIGTYTAITKRDSGSWDAIEDFQAAVKESWLVVEAVPEKLDIKIDTFVDLETFAPRDCILGTNSSSYKSGDLVAKLSDETKMRVLNTHFMMPPEALIVELMTSGHTHRELLDFMSERHKDAGLHPIVAFKESTGFVFNRIWAAIKRECLKVLAEGVSTPAEIDRVFKEQYDAKDGPCHIMDLIGLDTVEKIEEQYIKERGLTRSHVDWLHENYIAPGKLGKKSGKGGLYPKPEPGSQTKLFFLNLGTAEPLEAAKSLNDVTHRGQILSLNVDEGGKPFEIIGHDYMPDGLDIHHASKRMVWTHMGYPDYNDGELLSADLDGSDIRTVVPKGSTHTPKQCVIDQEAQKVYFSDREGLRVMRVDIDGSNLQTLVQTGDWKVESDYKDQTRWCVGIAISKKLGKMFWSQKGFSKASVGRIFSADLEMPQGATPSTRKDIELVASGLPEPIDLEMDNESGALYWTDRGELPLGNTLNKKQMVGDVPASEKPLGRQILAQGFGEAIGLRLDKKKDVVWVSDICGRIWKCDPHRPSLKEKVYEAPTGAFCGLAVMHV